MSERISQRAEPAVDVQQRWTLSGVYAIPAAYNHVSIAFSNSNPTAPYRWLRKHCEYGIAVSGQVRRRNGAIRSNPSGQLQSIAADGRSIAFGEPTIRRGGLLLEKAMLTWL